MESHNFVFLIIFCDQHFKNGPGEAIDPQIVIYILICYKYMCYS